MKDNSYVSLSLEKYNELYDKAKKYDEIIKVTDEFKNNLNEQSATTETPVKEELKVGDKVRLIKLTTATYRFNIGDICEVTDTNINANYKIKITHNDGYHGYVNVDCLEKINEREEN